jgi:hypothetical protein
MLKELVARLFLVLFIVGMTTEVVHDESAGTPKQPDPGSKNASASIPSETAN